MKISRILTLAVLLPFAALAQDDMPLVPLGLDADKFDFTGVWQYRTANHQVSGDCPNGTPISGNLTITRTDNAVGLALTSGATCNPASMCVFEGAIDDNGQLIVSNTDTVDEEGGAAANAMRVFFLTETQGAGFSASGYVHPGGFECQWMHYVELSR